MMEPIKSPSEHNSLKLKTEKRKDFTNVKEHREEKQENQE